MNKKRHVRVFIGKHPSLRGREVRVTSYLPTSFNLSFEWIADRSNPTEVLVENFNSSLAQLDRPVDDPPKTQVKIGRGVQENTRQVPQGQGVKRYFSLVFQLIFKQIPVLDCWGQACRVGALKTSRRYFPSIKKTSCLPQEITTRRLQGTTKPLHCKTTV